MSWNRVIDQRRVKKVLRQAVASGRVAHAYLFQGPRGVGKRAAALAFAQALECERRADGDADPCNRCRACRKVRRMVHPDVRVFFPHPKGAGEEDIARRIEVLGENPYATVDYTRRPSLDDPSTTSNKQSMYTVDRVREELLQPMSLKPMEGRYKVAVLTDAEQMRREAANAFLKLLEEPPPRTVFVLTTGRPDRLLPTITSRCQRLRFDPLSPDAIEKALRERVEPGADRAAMLARMADGSYSRALELARSDELMAHRALVLDYFRRSYMQDTDKLPALIEKMSTLGRERVKGLLRLMLRWVRDLMLVRTIGEEAPLVNVDQEEAARRFCRNVPQADLEAMTGLVEEAMELAGRNVHLGLLLTALSQALGRAMQGRKDAGRLYVPLPEAEMARSA